ncbi:MAG: thioredoxin domain-containing protein [Patescibacteria group bacterium]
MSSRHIAFLFIAFLSLVILVFFFIGSQPVKIPKRTASQNTTTLSEPTVTFVNPTKGAKDAQITIVEFADFQCGACKDLQVTLDAVLKAYPDDVRIVWKDLPNDSIHKEAIPAAIAAHCADRQGKFWEYHDMLFNRQTILSTGQYDQIAQDLKLDMDRFAACTQAKDTLPIVQRDEEEGIALKIVATPVLYIGKQTIVGAASFLELQQIIDELLKPAL